MAYPGEIEWRNAQNTAAKAEAPGSMAFDDEIGGKESPGIPDDLETMTFTELQDLGRALGLRRVTGILKEDLVEAIRGA